MARGITYDWMPGVMDGTRQSTRRVCIPTSSTRRCANMQITHWRQEAFFTTPHMNYRQRVISFHLLRMSIDPGAAERKKKLYKAALVTDNFYSSHDIAVSNAPLIPSLQFACAP
jgi:hypothetical protein